MCVVGPVYAFIKIRRSKHNAHQLAKAAAEEEGIDLRKHKKLSFCRNIFLGVHHAPTRQEELLFESRILRDPFSGLYAMCEQRAYYWFVVDLARKAVVTGIYIFGRNDRFDWQFVMLVFFVFFAINQDIAQPYRGRTENLFSFMTLMFIIILIHTSTTVNYGSLLPLIMAAIVVACTIVVFAVALHFSKQAEREHVADIQRRKRKAQDWWGHVAKNMLQLDPIKSSEKNLKAAFRLFDDADVGASAEVKEMRKTLSKSDSQSSISGRIFNPEAEGDGTITRGELKQLRDTERKLSGRRIPGVEDNGFAEIFSPTDEDVDEMVLEADTDGSGKISFEEFVSVIFNSWERHQQTEMLCNWLYQNCALEYCMHTVSLLLLLAAIPL